MGNRVSSAVGCLIPNRCSKHGDSAAAALGIHYCDPPPDEGLGHSFYYVRPATFGSDSSTPLEFSFESGSGMAEPDGAAAIGSGGAAAAAAATVTQADQGSGFGRGEVPGEQQHKRSATTRVSWERVPGTTSRRAPPGSSGSETSRPKSMSETSFKVISGASVSANTATPRSITSQEQFNSFSNILFDRASAFESTSSFNALPLQPVPRGSIPNSGPLSGPLSTGVPTSGTSLERGFLSGPLERGFMSGPMERGVLSGPLEAAYAGHFSAPLAELYQPSKLRRRTAALVKYVRTLSGPLQKALMRKMANALEKTHQSLFVPMKLFVMREGSKEDDRDRDCVMKHAIDLAPDMMVGNYDASSDPDMKEQANLQWAQGKAGEDRVHVVLSEEHGWLFVGIYDGFNGPDAPDFLMSNLYPAIYQELKGLLWDQDDIGFDSFCPGGSPEEKEASGAVDFPSIVGSDVEGDDEIRWQQQGSCGNNSLCQQLDSKPLDHCVWQSSEGNSIINHVDHPPIRTLELVNGDRDRGCKNMEFFYIPCVEELAVQKVNGTAAATAAAAHTNLVATNNQLTAEHNVMQNGNFFDLGCVLEENGNLDHVCQACLWLRKTVDDDEDAHNFPRENINCDSHCAVPGGNCHSSNVKKPSVCRTAVEMWDNSEGVLNEGTIGENVEAKHSPHLDLNGCRGEERIETSRDIDFLEQRINSEHTTSEQAACGGTFEKPQPVERLQQKKMRIRGDIEDKSSVRRPMDPLALQELQDCHTQQQPELLQCRCELKQQRLEAEKQLTQEKLQLKQQEAQDNERSSVDHGAVLEALERALKATEAAFLEMADRVLHENPELMVMGSCVLVMLMKDEDVYIMNVGDSRAVVAQQHSKSWGSLSHVGHAQPNGLTVEEPPEKSTGVRDTLLQLELDKIIEEAPTESKGLKLKNGSRSLASDPAPGSLLLDALQLSSDHSTSILEEVLRIKAEHPNDENAISNNRVKGQLKVTRAFGAGFLKQPVWNNALLKMFRCDFEGTDPYITCNPFLHHHRLGPQDHFLVLSSDGLYQYLSNEEVVSRVQWFMQNFPDGDPAQHLIEELLFRAAKKNGMDFHELLDIPQGDRRKYHDDVYVMVISLEGRIWKSAG